MKKIAIAILNWNGKNLLEKFLPSVFTNSPSNYCDIFIIDNGSDDDSIEFANKKFPEAKIIKLDKNYGFTGGYNKGLKEITSYEFFIILNSDIEVTLGWIEPLLDKMNNDSQIGICGPKLLDYHNKNKFEYAGASGGFIDKLGYPFCRGRIFDSLETDEGQYNSDVNCFWISGAALMIRSELFWKAGGFDESFFAHMEEIDLCWRVQNMGYKIVCIPDSFVYHLGGGTLSKENSRKTFFNFRNNLSLLYKNLPAKKLFSILTIRFFLDMLASFRMILQGSFKHTFAVYKAYFHFIIKIKKLRRIRKNIPQKDTRELEGIYNGSIVKKHFLKGVTKFSDLQ